MEDNISISTLNDFIFCPYSIYLHNVYMETDEGLYHAAPQTKGKLAHEPVDSKTSSNRKEEILALPVMSEQLGVMGKIDVYRKKEKQLIERKYQLKQIYQGQIYQLWAQYFCMVEMGYEVDKIAFYEISTNKTIPISLPTAENKHELMCFIQSFKEYDPSAPFVANPNKCRHCIYCNLCDKTEDNNVY
ncbi:MAG: type V CRISPR-associated protein Cas4 [Bacteroidales bacterium]|nr:type V CRISPR-associated protein Cas4 [Bacteroidales bacterium]